MKKFIALILSLTFVLALAGCTKEPGGDPTSVTFQATVIEISNETMLVSPVEGSQELKSSDRFSVSMENMEPSPEPEVGDIIEITYNGAMVEEYPAGLCGVSNIIVVEETNNIPTLAEVSQMKHEEVNEVLSERTINELRDAWGEPSDSDENGDSWQVDSSMIIIVKYNENTNSGIVESCELVCGTPLAAEE